jgi:hypothetical protein
MLKVGIKEETMNNKLIDFIGEKVTYDQQGQMIFGVKGDDLQLLLDVRGWGAIQHLNVDNPEKFQDDLGQWFADAVNEKLNRERNKTE